MKRFLIMVAVLALLVPGALLAQDGLSLEGLAEKMTALVERVNANGERVEAIESIWESCEYIGLRDWMIGEKGDGICNSLAPMRRYLRGGGLAEGTQRRRLVLYRKSAGYIRTDLDSRPSLEPADAGSRVSE